ncbi:MAG TPA: 3-phosphoshikimate 1-carboxyvinyltransferase [Flavisolibacter sp.]|nr:3-phosphoshikimate 1-carboxyvinyltransferase [Flavisolibacter sp.]
MKANIHPSSVAGTIVAPASKSAMQRACAAALIKGGRTVLHNPGISADDKAALDIITQLGAEVKEEGDTIVINSNGVRARNDEINCGESGLSVRMFTSIAALNHERIRVNGKGSLVNRPLSFFNEVLPQLGVECESNNGHLPLQIKGPLHPKNIEVDGSLSSQFLTGLLFAYSAAGARAVSIHVKNLNSKPYIDLTLKLMKDFRLPVPDNHNYTEFFYKDEVAHARDEKIDYTVEGDWSGGAFLLVAGAVAGDLVVKGLDLLSTQADRAVLGALMQSGANMSITDQQIEIRRSLLKPFHFNATDCPDLFPPLVALASNCKGTSVIEGVHRLEHKESNRALTLKEEFLKMGIGIELQDDLMVIKGGEGIHGTLVSAHHDHRIAMACAVAALNADAPMNIEGADAVNKSYPQFWDHLQQLKARLSLQQ